MVGDEIERRKERRRGMRESRYEVRDTLAFSY